MTDSLAHKLKILTEAAKYDASCASSGISRGKVKGGMGNTSQLGVCHSFTADGRCISLLKILYSNDCLYDCAYCANRRSNDIPRAEFDVRELTDLTLEFYRRNYIEGLFLSSAVIKSPDHTMERMLAVVHQLRTVHRFNGYIHMKNIPGASRKLVLLAGQYADRLSVNIEIPSERELKILAPGKDHSSVYKPMLFVRQGIQEYGKNVKKLRRPFVPAGQSTQMIIGAGKESDSDILRLSSLLYRGPQLKRVYYSAYIAVNAHARRLPALPSPPLLREHRLYQADWRMRRYHFDVEEILDKPDLDLDIDPKIAWALRHPDFFPLDVNRAEYERLLRVPGIGLTSAQRIVLARRFHKLEADSLTRLGVVMKRARFFLTIPGLLTIHETRPETLRAMFAEKRALARQPKKIIPPRPLSLLE